MATLVGPSGYASLNGWVLLNNVWNQDGLVEGKNYSIQAVINNNDLTAGTNFQWSFPVNQLPWDAVRAYPDILFGVSPWGRGQSDPTLVFPIQVKNLHAMQASYSLDWSGETGSFDVAYDIWFTSKPNGDVSTITNEVMIWLHRGNLSGNGQIIGTYSDGNFSGTIYHTGTYTAIIANFDTKIGSIDITNVISTLENLNVVSSSEYLASVQLGAEVVQGQGSLTINQADLSIVSSDGKKVTATKISGSGASTVAILPDTTAPAVTIALKVDTGIASNDCITSSAALTGSGDAGATVTIRNGSSILGTTKADSSGVWSFTPTALTDRTYTLTAAETDAAGNTGSATLTLTLDTKPPSPFIKIITGNSDGGITLTGVSEANSTVTVTDTAGGKTATLGTITATSSGTWQITTHTVVNTSIINSFAASSTDVAGNIGSMAGKLFLTSTATDSLTSNAGFSDVFAVMSFKGSDVINGFETTLAVGANHDFIDFSGRGITSFNQVKMMMSGSSSTLISIGSGKTISLNGIAPSQLTASDFVYS